MSLIHISNPASCYSPKQFWSCFCKYSFAGLDLPIGFPWQSPFPCFHLKNAPKILVTNKWMLIPGKNKEVRPADGGVWCRNIKIVVSLLTDCRRDGLHRKKKLYSSRFESSECSGFGLTDVQNCWLWTSKSHRRQRVYSKGRYVFLFLSLNFSLWEAVRLYLMVMWSRRTEYAITTSQRQRSNANNFKKE